MCVSSSGSVCSESIVDVGLLDEEMVVGSG
jgi:hypothetical protein